MTAIHVRLVISHDSEGRLSILLSRVVYVTDQHHREIRQSEADMFGAKVTRWFTTPLLTVAVVVQSFAATGLESCECSTSSNSARANACCCVQQTCEQKSCCCSATRDEIQSSALERQKKSTPCCSSNVAGHACQCGCCDRHPEPVTPAPSSLSDVNWESLFVECYDATTPVSTQPRLGTTLHYDGVWSFASTPSVQVLFCTWLT